MMDINLTRNQLAELIYESCMWKLHLMGLKAEAELAVQEEIERIENDAFGKRLTEARVWEVMNGARRNGNSK
jgi:hypothetical protein